MRLGSAKTSVNVQDLMQIYVVKQLSRIKYRSNPSLIMIMQRLNYPDATLQQPDLWGMRLIMIGFVMFSLMPYGLSWDYEGMSSLTSEGSIITKLETGGLFLLATVLLYRNLATTIVNLRHINPFLVLSLCWCLCSAIWSPLPATTFKRVIQLYGIVMMALALQLHRNPIQLFIDTLLYSLSAILLLSLVVVIVKPSMGIDYDLGGAWRGSLSQKNELGQIAALTVLLWQAKACYQKLDIKYLMTGLLFSLFMLVMSKSSTSISTMLLTSFAFHLLRRQWLASSFWLLRSFLALFAIALVLTFIFFMFESRLPMMSEITGPIAKLFGKGTDLTGRTDIWELVWLEINKHPWMGLGYGSFWMGLGSLSQFVIDNLHWIPLQSHNGYLDIINEQGYIGLSFAVLTLLWQFYLLVKLAHYSKFESAFWATAWLITVITNATESSMLRGFLFQNIYYLFSLVFVSSSLWRYRLKDSLK